MTVIARTGAVEVTGEDGERVVWMLRDIAVMATILLSQEEGGVERTVIGYMRTLGGTAGLKTPRP